VTLTEFRDKLAARNCRPTGNGPKLEARCPAHDDKRASLSVTEASDGKLLVQCHAGCETEAVCAALRLTLADLFPDTSKGNGGKAPIVATYDYRDESGKLLFQVCRKQPKDFRQRTSDGAGGWTWTTKGVRRVLYRLPETLAAMVRGEVIHVAEGEKDVAALVEKGVAATCNPGGAGKWRAEYTATLKGASVVIVADKDGPGRKHAADVAGKLQGVAASVRVVELPDTGGKPIKDAADFFAAGGTAAQFKALCEQAPQWTPPAQPPPADTVAASADIRGLIVRTLLSKDAPFQQRQKIADAVVAELSRAGRLFHHAELRDFETAMFFNAHRKRLERIRSDSFLSWLSEWLAVNRAENLFRHIQAAVETAAVSSTAASAILPAAYWHAAPEAVYLSNGDGQLVRLTARGLELCDNGTDGVLFAAGKTLKPWNVEAVPADPFETCRLFRDTRAAAAHGKGLLRTWLYSLPTNPRCKPPLCLAGEIGSGKTRLAAGMAELYGVPFNGQKVEESSEADFWPTLDAGGLVCFDNADSRTRWLADALACAATGGSQRRRRLYTNAELVTLRANAWLVVTTANPTFANDAGLADRLLLVRTHRADGDTSDAALSDEIAANRDAGLVHIAETIAAALRDSQPTPTGLNQRHPDFAAFAVRIGRALDREAETVAALQTAEADKSAFCLENDTVAAALLAYLATAGTFTGTAAELVPHLIATDSDLTDRLSAKRLGKRLAALWPHLQKALPVARRESDRNHFTRFTFKANRAECAEFQMAIS
jgi:hypothetical protein